jgi:hypothetical protein
MNRAWIAGALVLAYASGAETAAAQVEEIRFGSAAHNVLDRERKERSANRNMEMVFRSPALLKFLGSPRPYMMVSSSSSGATSWAGFGLYWRVEIGEWVIEPGLGYVVHNGWNDARHVNGDPHGGPRILFGSRDLFRETLALERTSGPRAARQVFVEHLSHGQILGAGRNQGTEEIGARTIWRFAERRRASRARTQWSALRNRDQERRLDPG